ncbi:hypothetical protein ABWK22_14065 [Gottfriedia acidiceleris]
MEKEEYSGTVSVSILPCKIEIATDVKLRDKLNLKDGDLVEVVIS